MSSGKNDRVRIISGTWKGRRIPVLAKGNIRPTGDRAKTTLFNWLAPDLAGSRTLDLFAGTGALGLEALSRGAAHTTFIEQSPRAARQLREVCVLLDIDSTRAVVVNGEAVRWLKRQHQIWDIVFVDPPFKEHTYYGKVLAHIAPRLSEFGLVYIEHSRRDEIDMAGFQVWKESTLGEVQIALLRRAAD